jgi:hypothetical protein
MNNACVSHRPIPDQCIDAILDHLVSYRLSVFAAVERLPVFAASRPGHVKDALKECQRASLVGSAPLHHGARYWYLDTLGAEACGLCTARVGPLTEPAKIRALAVLRFCCLSDRPRYRLSAEDLADAVPGAARQGLSGNYYFDPEGPGRLGLVRVDAGRRGRWDRIVQSIRDDVQRHSYAPGFRQLVQAGRFEIAVLTVLHKKAARIYESLALRPHSIPVRVVAIPELLPLIASCR